MDLAAASARRDRARDPRRAAVVARGGGGVPRPHRTREPEAECGRGDARGRSAARRRSSRRCRRERRSPGLLHGVPITIKDSFDTAGAGHDLGHAGSQGLRARADATAVARLRAAGAIVLGKTNTPELTLGFESREPRLRPDQQPLRPRAHARRIERRRGGDRRRGRRPLDLGSDTGGSIRLPAHFCGIAGHPADRRVACRARGTRSGLAPPIDALTTIGPLARRVADLVLALRVLVGPDRRDPFLAPVPLGDPAAVALAGLRVALFTDNGVTRADAPVANAVRAAAGVLAEAGAHVVEYRPPAVARTEPLFMNVMLIDGGPGSGCCSSAPGHASRTVRLPASRRSARSRSKRACG